ncbi:zinc ABC transporter ATP-binding protein AztA [Saccharomonospora sp. NPDC046836]|uniref:zinc ABC transporter ATP-binding protein AztA n=1 Tax=Saccharomonospora sp. NPDC046836 TaxID=3156921 RepID=UPI0033E030A6
MAGVRIDALSAGYAGRVVLHGISARLPSASITAIAGPNGSGKSTLLGAVAGVVPPGSGSVVLPGGTRPAFVVQRSAVSDRLPITVRETVAMGRWAHSGPWRRLSEEDHVIVADALARLGIADLARRRLGSLSGGQRQRALVAQGLAQRADVLLLDEPTTGLDGPAREAITDALAGEAARGAAVVHVTHDLAEADRADHCLLLGKGRLLAEGPPAGVLTADALDTAWGLRR